MPREIPQAMIKPSALPSYAHPPLVQVRMSIGVAEPLSFPPAVLTEQLGPAWITKSVTPPTYQSLLGDQQFAFTAQGIDLLWDGRLGDPYPHYESLRDAFLLAFDAWCHAAEMSALTPTTWQVAYRNRFPRGTVWQSLDDLRFCTLLATTVNAPRSGQLLGIDHFWTYRIEEPATVLSSHVWLESALPGDTDEDAIWLELSCEGSVTAGTETEWLADLDAARRLIVATFHDLMSPAANAYWGLTS